jgi:hypothetical protein
MRAGKLILVGTVLGSALIVTIVSQGSLHFGQPTSVTTDAPAPRENVSQDHTPDVEPWGPFRTVDW